MERFISPTNDLCWFQEDNIPITEEIMSSVSLSSESAEEAQLLADRINASVNRGNAPPNDITEEHNLNRKEWKGGGGVKALKNYLNQANTDKNIDKCDKISNTASHMEDISTGNSPTNPSKVTSPPCAPPRSSSTKTIPSTSSVFLPIKPLPSSRPLSEVTSLPFSKVMPILSTTQESKNIIPPSLTLKVTVTPLESLKNNVSTTSSSPSISTSSISTATTFPTVNTKINKENVVQTKSTTNISTNTMNYCLLSDIDIDNSKNNSGTLKSCLKSGNKSGRVFVKSRSESPSKPCVNFKEYDTVNFFITPDEILETDFPYETIDTEGRSGIIQFGDSTDETFSIVHFSNEKDKSSDNESPYEIMDFHSAEEGGRKGVIVSLKPLSIDNRSEASVNTGDIFMEPTDNIIYPTCQIKETSEVPVKKERGRQKYQGKQHLKTKKKRAQSFNPFTRKQDDDLPKRRLSVFDNQNIEPNFPPEKSDIACDACTQTVHKTDGCSIM